MERNLCGNDSHQNRNRHLLEKYGVVRSSSQVLEERSGRMRRKPYLQIQRLITRGTLGNGPEKTTR